MADHNGQREPANAAGPSGYVGMLGEGLLTKRHAMLAALLLLCVPAQLYAGGSDEEMTINAPFREGNNGTLSCNTETRRVGIGLE